MTEVASEDAGQFRLGRELGRGGEGSVFEVLSQPQWVAKIYHSLPSAAKATKIRVMVGLRTERVDKLTAWPIDLLTKPSGEAIGVLLPKVAGHRLVHELYSPKSRRHVFVRGDWRFLLRAATNTARAFAAVHAAGCIIGDVNHGGVLVAEDATVKLIDCDSFQVVSDGHEFLCDVGIDTFTPPELQGVPFARVLRTENHDNFGLAVLIFLLLFMGRHPFAGLFQGKGEMPLNKAIAQSRFAYGGSQSITQMVRPPNAPDLASVGALGPMFERAFSSIAVHGGRPKAAEWADALAGVERKLKQCRSNLSHWHVGELSTCPWCRIEAEIGIRLFPNEIAQAPGSLFNLEALWREVGQVKHPGPAPAIPRAAPQPSSAARAVGRRRRYRVPLTLGVGGVLVAVQWFGSGYWRVGQSSALVICLLAGLWALSRWKDVRRFRAAHRHATGLWRESASAWIERAGPAMFDAKIADLVRGRDEWLALADQVALEQRKRQEEQRQFQLVEFLGSRDLRSADISGVSEEDELRLAAEGILTAADVVSQKLDALPRAVRRRRPRLLVWRESLAAGYRSSIEDTVGHGAEAAIEQELLDRRWPLERELVEGKRQLLQIAQSIAAARQSLRDDVIEANQLYQQTAINLKAARGSLWSR